MADLGFAHAYKILIEKGLDDDLIADAAGVKVDTLRKAVGGQVSESLVKSLNGQLAILELAQLQQNRAGSLHLPVEMRVLKDVTPTVYAEEVAGEFRVHPSEAPHGPWTHHILITSLPILESRSASVCRGLLEGLCWGKRFDYYTFQHDTFARHFGRRSERSAVQSMLAWSEAGTDQVKVVRDRLYEAAREVEQASRTWPQRKDEPRPLVELLAERVRFFKLPWHFLAPNEKAVVMLKGSLPREQVVVQTFRDTVLPGHGTSGTTDAIIDPYSDQCRWYRSHFPTDLQLLESLLGQPDRFAIEW